MSEFDEKAATWDKHPYRVERAVLIADYFRKHVDLSQVHSSLEYGSGTGLLSFALKEALPDITLMDGSVEMTKVAQQKINAQGVSNMHAIHYDLMEQSLPKEKYDLIFNLLTLHHIDDTVGFLNKCAQLLNPGGQLVLIDLDKEDGTFHDGPFDGHKGFERNDLESKLKDKGFSIEHYGVCYKIVKEREDGSSKEFPLFMLVAKK